jgi:predicted ATP-grasp superfamily ATP-dependent carboligase
LDETVQRLTAALGLRGLNGVDFILEGDRCFVLELNPRPTATIDLYDADVEVGLLAVHIAACQGTLPAPVVISNARAHAIVYAGTVLRVPAKPGWPAWCTDLPEPGSVIPAGAPVCSVRGEGETSAAAREATLARRNDIERFLGKRAA